MVTYKITYLDVTHGRRVSFSDAIGVNVQVITRSGKLQIKSNVIFTAPCVSRS